MTAVMRPARQEEARVIAEFYRLSSDGVADYIWSRLAEPGEDLLDVGERRYARTDTNFSFQNCTFLEYDSQVVGMLVVFPMMVDPGYEEADPVLAPYSTLEEDESLYICGLSVLKPFRRKGLGSALLKEAEKTCRQRNLGKISLACFERNTAARDMYLNAGYRIAKRCTVHSHPLLHYEGEALLMVKHLDQHATDRK